MNAIRGAAAPVLVLAALAVGCSSSKPAAPAAPPPRLHQTGSPGIPLPGDANGIYWDARAHALYLTDSTHGTVVEWTDAKGFAEVASLPPAGKLELGGLVRLPDGTFVVTSFGFGTAGAVFAVRPGRPAVLVPNLDPTRRRIGVAIAADGTLYDAYFVAEGHRHTGGLAKLDLARGETDVVTRGLGKAVGVAATPTALYVSDQDTHSIFRVAGDALQPLATGLPGVDLLTVLPDGSLVTGGKTGTIVRVAPGGAVTRLASGFEEVRGTAYDPVGKRLFVVEHSKATSNHTLHILPVPP